MLIHHIRRAASSPSLRVLALGAAATGLVAAADPSAASAALAAAVTAVTCASTNACVTGTNTSSGPGVKGVSAKGYGVQGTSTSNIGVAGTGNTLGIYGVGSNTGGAIGVEGYAGGSNSYGLFGSASGPGGVGLYGNGTGGGTYGHSATANGATGNSGSGNGVYGYSGTGTGVYGTSVSGGVGVKGEVSGGTAVMGHTSSGGSAVAGFGGGSSTAVYASSGSGYGVLAQTSGSSADAVYGSNFNGNGSDISGTYIGMIGRAPTAGYPLVLTDASNNDVFWVDGYGSVHYRGDLLSFTRTAGGATVSSFSAKTTLPTVEDTGTAQLVGGTATIRFDPAFAASIDLQTPYRVFLTPGGDTHGLFVATKAAGGFVVRETEGGHSTLSFDYRIVATALGRTGQRMTVVNPAAEPRSAPASVPHLLAPAGNSAAPPLPVPPQQPGLPGH